MKYFILLPNDTQSLLLFYITVNNHIFQYFFKPINAYVNIAQALQNKNFRLSKSIETMKQFLSNAIISTVLIVEPFDINLIYFVKQSIV
jgi:hypothetical protein